MNSLGLSDASRASKWYMWVSNAVRYSATVPVWRSCSKLMHLHLEFVRREFGDDCRSELLPRRRAMSLSIRLVPVCGVAVDVERRRCHPAVWRNAIEVEVGYAAVDPEVGRVAVEPRKVMLGGLDRVLLGLPVVEAAAWPMPVNGGDGHVGIKGGPLLERRAVGPWGRGPRVCSTDVTEDAWGLPSWVSAACGQWSATAVGDGGGSRCCRTSWTSA